MYTDSHCHLDPDVYGGDAGVDAVVDRARDAGVGTMVTIGSGYGAPCAEAAVRVAERHPDVWCTVGLHPHDAKLWDDALRARLMELARHPRCVAFGEMGLDFHYYLSPRNVQRRVLRAQIAAALEVGRPIVIHDRESDGETLAILQEEGAFGGGVLFHCFTGDVALMERIVADGGYISIPGIVTFKNAGSMREVARQVPLDRLLVETDSPFLTPVPHRGTQNEPARVVLVADFVAGLRDLDRAELARVTSANARRFYGVA